LTCLRRADSHVVSESHDSAVYAATVPFTLLRSELGGNTAQASKGNYAGALFLAAGAPHDCTVWSCLSAADGFGTRHVEQCLHG
jgi:hypothetical protein